MTLLLVAGLAIGILAVTFARRNLGMWPRMGVVGASLALAFYGQAPEFAIVMGLFEKSAVNVVFAFGYFVAFSIVGNLVLWGTYYRGQKAKKFD